jgi:hypothetical protein
MGTNKNDLSTFDARAAIEVEKNQKGYYRTLTWQERMIVANYLNSIKYNYPENEPPRMDKTAFSMRSRNDPDKSAF